MTSLRSGVKLGLMKKGIYLVQPQHTELKIIYNEIKFIEKNINNPYSAIIKNNELNILFISQSKILNNIKNELNNYNINSNDKANILKNSLIPNIKQYLNNYNKIWNIMKHKNQNKTKIDTI